MWKVFKKSKIVQIYYYDPQSAGINLQSPQSDSTPWTLTLVGELKCIIFFRNKNYFLFRRFGKREPNPIWMTRLVSLIYIACLFFRCPRNWVRYIQSCYKFTRSPIKRWDDARLQCQAYRHQDSDNSGTIKFIIQVPTK